MAIIAYPLNDIDYDAEDAQSYFAPRTAGIFSLGKDYVVTSSGGMGLTVSTGRGWMKPSEFTGFSVVSTEPTALTVAESHPTMDRYDRVVLRYDKGANTVEILLVEGAAATDAKAPDIQRTDTVYELGLAIIHVPAGVFELTTDNIEDTRMDVTVCGIVGNDWIGGQSVIKATFAEGQAGKTWNLTEPGGEVHSGEVPPGLVFDIPVGKQNTTYTLTVADSEDSGSVYVEKYYGVYELNFGEDLNITELNDASWDDISAASASRRAASIWAVGDTKTIVLNGTVGILTLDNLSIDVFILGFNHNAKVEGNNLIHFMIGKIDGTLASLVDSKYTAIEGSRKSFCMQYPASTSTKGWDTCGMRKTILGGNVHPSEAASGTFMSVLPEDLKAVMKPASKYTYVMEDGILASVDYLSLISEFEFTGVREYANSLEQTRQVQYEYFALGNQWSFRKHNKLGETADSWTRSVYYSDSTYFVVTSPSILSDGRRASYIYSNRSLGISPIFFV